MSAPIWFLDIDGVINALADDTPVGCRRTTAMAIGRGWAIRYSPVLIDFINRVSREGLAEVRWLTTWEQDAHLSLAPQVGLDAFLSYDIPDDDSPSGWWKADIVAASIVEEVRPFIWTDDDLATEDISAIRDEADVPHLCIAPPSATGLNEVQLQQIETFLAALKNNESPRVSWRLDYLDPASVRTEFSG